MPGWRLFVVVGQIGEGFGFRYGPLGAVPTTTPRTCSGAFFEAHPAQLSPSFSSICTSRPDLDGKGNCVRMLSLSPSPILS